MNSLNVPKLRFPGFDGEWELKKLGEVSSFLDGRRKPIKSGDRAKMKGEFPYYGASGIIDYVNSYIFDEELILLGEDGENIISRNLPLAFRVSGKCWINNHAHVIVPKENTNIDFLTHNLERINYVVYNTGTAQPKLNQEVCRNIPSRFPTLPEQQKIASFLSAVDEKIQQLSRKKELVEQYKKGVMQQLFSGKLRFKDENGKDYPDWEEKKLGDVCDVRDGTHDSPKYVDKGFPFITSKNLMKNGSIDFENISFINEMDYNKINQRSKVNINDILFGMIGTIGNPVLVKSEGFAIKNVALIKEKKDLLNLFLIHFLKGDSINQQFFEQNTGGTQKFLSLSVIRNLIAIVPSLPEQQKIANFLSGIDGKIAQVNGELVKTQEYKKGLLQQMFV
ncbi:restriction endonuclease subunit S [Flavobacterium sp. FZUC8N2.13]|uniref:Restriction endonuclease subunit S n=1 Tax=Flavobacterium zubiriense TaxID=3138075 RepID=A0ABV4TF84_9FLAO